MSDFWSMRHSGGRTEFSDDSGIFLRAHPQVGDANRAVDDLSAADGDGNLFGADSIAGRTVALSFGVDGATAAETRSRYETLAALWRADSIRSKPGATFELVAPSGRAAIGRPRRIAPSEFRLLHYPPAIDIEADFETADDLWYADQLERIVTLGTIGVGAIEVPMSVPVPSTPPTERPQGFTVGGSVDTWGIFTAFGPISAPEIEIPGVLRYSFSRLTLAYDQWIQVDTRPWRRTILRNDGAPLGGALDSSSSLLSEGGLPPGAHQLVLRGSSPTGTPRASVRWRDAFTTP
jgi:hypothetical protein